MTQFDYALFHKLFDNLFVFGEAIGGDLESDEQDFTDHSGKDISACLSLSIFPQLKDITRWGENVELSDYFEIKDGDRIVGAKGVIVSGMDWCDPGEPRYYYEFAHLETDGQSEEYVRELHIDNVIMKVMGHLDTKSSAKEKGSEETRKLIAELMKNNADVKGQETNLKYRCLVEAKYFEVWKVGFHQGPYALLLTAPNHIMIPNVDTRIKKYLRGEKSKGLEEPLPLMKDEELAKVIKRGYGNVWYHVGIVDLDPELTSRLQQETKDKAQQELADRVYNATLSHNFERIDIATLQDVLPRYTPLQIALMSVASMDTKEHTEQFGKTFLQQCQQYCPDKLKSANTLISQVKDMAGR